MARNRKYRSAAIRFGPALKAFFLCLLIGGSGVGYVWQKNQIAQLGQQLKRSEMRLDQAKSLNKRLETTLQGLRDPGILKQKIKEFNLGLVEPPRSQIWVLPEPAPDSFQSNHERQYVFQDSGNGNSRTKQAITMKPN
jgi:hypothetical protein